MSRPIVVAVDGSEESLRAAEWAAREAVRRTAPLRIVSAPGLLPRMRTYQASPAIAANALRGIAARALADAVDRVNEVAAGGVLVDTGLLEGPPGVAVPDSGTGAQLLVVGARGVGGFAALVLGSVSRQAATHAVCPTVVVREETEAVHREIVVGVREPDDAEATLGFAFEEAALRGASLTALHALSWHERISPESAPGSLAARAETAAKLHLEAVLDLWRQKYPDVAAAAEVIRGRPAHLLSGRSAHADLVVIGRHGVGGPDDSSIQHAVLGHARGPVAIIPSGGLPVKISVSQG